MGWTRVHLREGERSDSRDRRAHATEDLGEMPMCAPSEYAERNGTIAVVENGRIVVYVRDALNQEG